MDSAVPIRTPQLWERRRNAGGGSATAVWTPQRWERFRNTGRLRAAAELSESLEPGTWNPEPL